MEDESIVYYFVYLIYLLINLPAFEISVKETNETYVFTF